jgi:uncharacterized membrane protein YhaH (DUF805 family)
MGWSHLLFSFQGRANRAKYWLAGLLLIVVWSAYFFVALVMLGFRLNDLLLFASTGLFLWLVGVALYLATMWASFAVGVKRMHDRDKSGWWTLLFYVAPGILSGWQVTTPSVASVTLLGYASLAILVWGIVELGFLRGTPGANRFGPDPLNRLSDEPLR